MSTSRRSLAPERSSIRYGSEDGPKQVNPDDLAFKYQDASAEPANGSSLPELDLVGAGYPYHECGDPRPTKFCSDCGEPIWGRRACRRPRCPECWESWAAKNAVSHAAKLEERRARIVNRTGDSPKFHHVAVSPPPGFTVSEGALEHAFDIVKEFIEEVGGSEGYIIYHPYRIKPEYLKEGWAWKDILELPEEERGKYLVFAPHFHVFTLSDYITGGQMTKQLEEDTGWIVERITKAGDSNVSLFGLTDLVAATAYCFSHAGIDRLEGDNDRVNPQLTARYFGETANCSARDYTTRQVEDAAAEACPRVLGIERPRGTHEVPRHFPDSLSTSSSNDRPDISEATLEKGTEDDFGFDEPSPSSTSDETETADSCGGRLVDFYQAPAKWCSGEIDEPPPDLVRAIGIYVLTK